MKKNKLQNLNITNPLMLVLLGLNVCFSHKTFSQEKTESTAPAKNSTVQFQASSNANETSQPVLNLEASMNMAEVYSFKAKVDLQEFYIAEAKEDAVFRGMLPTVSLSGNYMQNSSDVNPLVGNSAAMAYGFPDTTSSTGTLSVSQPIIGLLPMFYSLQQSSALTRAALQTRIQSRIDARFYGAQAFINLQKADQLLKAAKSAMEVSEKQLNDGNAQFNAGRLTNADLLKFKLDFENSKTSVLQAQTTYKVALITLAEAIGIKNSSAITVTSSEKSVWEMKSQKLPSLENILYPGLARRNDLLAAKENVEAAKQGKNYSYTSYLPSLNFVANYTRNFMAKDVTIAGQPYSASSIQDQFSYGIQLSWVILDWGVRQAQISGAVAAEQKAKYSLENLNLNARIDITNSYLQLQNAIQVLDSAKVSVQYAQDVYSQMKARFDNGQVTATDLITAANDQTNARANLANARGSLDLAWITFQKSTGSKLTSLN
ncbi:TolC family protein [Pigmentibacter sp. JX0631]|uniref:TolC family protein n=1 Tax=Pigmentibacter sp. JX0631 TaxID=2976982 RepID=UPI0024686B1B|nr:TolC family protein [Pigmentibacter sp. JX0631]WGL58962.1 TolC family protein [Pigmentibacter sp. JX0631]